MAVSLVQTCRVACDEATKRKQLKSRRQVGRHGDSTTSRWRIYTKVEFVRIGVEYTSYTWLQLDLEL